MNDAVAVELVLNDIDDVMADHFTDQEHFTRYVNEQDYDLDTCLGLCDSVQLLNQDTCERDMEEGIDIVAAGNDFEEMLSIQERERQELEAVLTRDTTVRLN